MFETIRLSDELKMNDLEFKTTQYERCKVAEDYLSKKLKTRVNVDTETVLGNDIRHNFIIKIFINEKHHLYVNIWAGYIFSKMIDKHVTFLEALLEDLYYEFTDQDGVVRVLTN